MTSIATATAVRTAAFARDTVTFDYAYDDCVESTTVLLAPPTAGDTANGTVLAWTQWYGYRSYSLAKITNMVVNTKN